jgi:hypothetical protein
MGADDMDYGLPLSGISNAIACNAAKFWRDVVGANLRVG